MAEITPPAQAPSANSEAGPDQALDGTLDVDIDMNLEAQPDTNAQDPVAESIPEPPPAPTKKDISLREFLGKMDDYAPIVRSPCLYLSKFSLYLPIRQPSTTRHGECMANIQGPSPPHPDPRRSNSPPSPPCRAPPLNNPTTPRAPPRARNPEIHRRHRRRRLPIQPYALLSFNL